MQLTKRSKSKIESIVITAQKLFAEFGYNLVTMDSIAQNSHVSKVTLYKYFSDKRKLFEHILIMNYLEEFDNVVSIINSEIPFQEKIEGVIKARLVKYYDKSKLLYKEEFPLSKETLDFTKEYTVKMDFQRSKLYNEGRMQGYIDNNISDETLVTYFRVIQAGLVHTFSDLSDLESDKLKKLLEILYSGMLQCKK